MTSMSGQKREPIAHAINPAGVSQMGSAMGNHVTGEGKILHGSSVTMDRGRGWRRPWMQGERSASFRQPRKTMMDRVQIEQLFNVVEATHDHGPKYAPIITVAQLELEEHLVEAQKIVADKVKADAEEAGRLRAEAANKAREEADKQKADDEAQAEAQKAAREYQLETNAAAATTAGDVGLTTPVRRI